MPINPSIISSNVNDLEYNKFVEIIGDSRFPPVTSVIQSYDDNVLQTNIYNKKAILTFEIGAQSTNASPFGDNAASDAFGRLRVGLPSTLLDTKFLYDKQPQFFDEVVNIGSSSFIPNDSLVQMSTSGNGGYVIRQTTSKFNYQPGKSLFCVYTFVASPETNIIKRIGSFQSLTAAPFTPIDGLYLEITTAGVSFNLVKTSGTVNTLSIPQSGWNIDKLNGSGASGLTIDFTKGQIFAIDYEWLGLGRIRFGFYLNGKLYYAHQITNLNNLTAPYITSPNQPVRYEIRQTGVGSGSMKQICATVIDEGVPEITGTLTSFALSATTTIQNGIMTPIIGLRVNPNYPNLVFLVNSYDVYNTDNTNNMLYTVFRNPVINNSLTWRDIPNSYLQYAIGNNTLTLSGGFGLYSGFVPKSQGTSSSTGTASLPGLFGRFGTQINGNPDTLIIGGMGLGAAVAVYSSFNATLKA